MSTVFTNRTTFTVIACPQCSMEFAITAEFEQQRRSKRDSFYCPAGHSQWFPGITDAQCVQKLTSQLDMERTRADNWKKTAYQREKQLDYSRRATKANATRLRKVKDRVKNGVCPCCNRTFVNLQRHMHTKHPSYGDSHES